MADGEPERVMRSHRNTYHFFTGLMKYGALLAVLSAFVIILIISN
jgi:hypothetical protein